MTNTIEKAAIVPEVGMGATVRGYGDADACTVVAVDKKGVVTLRDDKTTISGRGAYGSPGYAYEPNPNGRVYNFRRDPKTGDWEQVGRNPDTGRWNKQYGYVDFGVRNTHFNPHI